MQAQHVSAFAVSFAVFRLSDCHCFREESSSTNHRSEFGLVFVDLVAAWRLRISMAGHNASNSPLPSIDDLQSWANDQDLARSQLKAIFAALESEQEEPMNWATEALENMGPPLMTDIAWLGTVASSKSPDAVYWAVTLLGRSDDPIDSVQDSIAGAVLASQSTPVIRRRAISALAKVQTRSKATESAIQSALKSDDSQLAGTAREILQSV